MNVRGTMVAANRPVRIPLEVSHADAIQDMPLMLMARAVMVRQVFLNFQFLTNWSMKIKRCPIEDWCT